MNVETTKRKMKIPAYRYIILCLLVITAVTGCGSGCGSGGDAEIPETREGESRVVAADDDGISIGDEVGTPGIGEAEDLPQPVRASSVKNVSLSHVNIDDSLNGYGIPQLWRVTAAGRHFFTSRHEKKYDDSGFTRFLHFKTGLVTWYLQNNETKKIYRLRDSQQVLNYSSSNGELEAEGWEKGLFHYDSGDENASLYFFDETEKGWHFLELKRARRLKGNCKTVSARQLQALRRLRGIASKFRGDPDNDGTISVAYRYRGREKVDLFHPVIAMAYDLTDDMEWREYSAGFSTGKKGTITINGLDPDGKYRVILFRPEGADSERPGQGDIHWISGNVQVRNNRFTAEPEIIDMTGGDVRLEAELHDGQRWDEGLSSVVVTGLSANAVDETGNGITDYISLKVTAKGSGVIESMKVTLYSPARAASSFFAGDLAGQEVAVYLKAGGENEYIGRINGTILLQSGIWQVGAITGTALDSSDNTLSFSFFSAYKNNWLQKYLYAEVSGNSDEFALMRKTSLNVADIPGVKISNTDTKGPELMQISEVSESEETSFHFIVEYDDENFTETPGAVTGKIVFSGNRGTGELQVPLLVADSTSAYAAVMTPWGKKILPEREITCCRILLQNGSFVK